MTASIWTPGSNNVPAVDPRSQLKSETFTASEGQTSFSITQFTYTINNGALTVFVNRAKVPGSEVTESSSTTFSIPACEAGDLVEVVGNTAIQDAEGAAAVAEAAAAAALVSETNAASSASTASGAASTASSASATAVAAAAAAAQYVPLDWEGAWLTATSYQINDAVKEGGSSYICIVAHTSGTFATDLAAAKWDLIAEKGAAGAGTGDMIAANNLSDLTNAATARNNLGLGTAATHAHGDYATAAHTHTGVYEPADGTILKSANIGSTVQGYDADTAKLDVAQVWTAQQTAKNGALTDGTTIDWNGATNGQVVAVTLGGNRTMNAPTNIVQYAMYVLRVAQDGTGSRTLAFNAAYKFGTAGAPALTTTASKVDILGFIGGAGNTLEYTGIRKDAV
jgi:hypothetical protein